VVGERFGLSPFGAKFGFGRFEVVSVKPKEHAAAFEAMPDQGEGVEAELT
jgi:hypothetical protein